METSKNWWHHLIFQYFFQTSRFGSTEQLTFPNHLLRKQSQIIGLRSFLPFFSVGFSPLLFSIFPLLIELLGLWYYFLIFKDLWNFGFWIMILFFISLKAHMSSSSRSTSPYVSVFSSSSESIIYFPLYSFSEVSVSIAICAPEIYLPVVRLFLKELDLIPIVEHTLILRGRVELV